MQLQGHLLAASPHLAAVPQARSVVLILGHSDQGSTGVVLNHPLNENLHRSVRQMLSQGQTPQLIHDLFTPPAANPQGTTAAPILPQIPIGDSIAVPFGLLVAPSVDPKQGLMVRVMVGQVHWPAGQLEKEIAAGIWMEASSSPELVFGQHENLWQMVVKEVGDKTIESTLGVGRLPFDPQCN